MYTDCRRDASASLTPSASFDHLRDVVVYDYVVWKIPNLTITEHDIRTIHANAAAETPVRGSIHTDVDPELHPGVSLNVFVDDGRIYITDLISWPDEDAPRSNVPSSSPAPLAHGPTEESARFNLLEAMVTLALAEEAR